MIYLESTNGPKRFTKAVFVWTGHVNSGWPTTFPTYTYNDELNGLLCFGHDDHEVQELMWFIPHGSVARTDANCATPEEGLEAFKQLYGDRLIIWMNPKENIPMLHSWAQSDYVLTPADLKIAPFEGATRTDFKAWAEENMGLISSTEQSLVIPRQL